MSAGGVGMDGGAATLGAVRERIAALVEATLELSERRGEMAEPQSVEEALAIDHNARRLAADLVPEIAAMAS